MRPGSNTRRPRGRPNRKQHGSPRSHSYDSHGPDVRIRGNAPQVYEKYLTLARDATSSGDRIAAESYYQFAEHYFRIMNDSTDPQRASQEPNRAPHDSHRVNRERSYVSREQPHVEWPTDGAGGGNGAAGEPAPADQMKAPVALKSEEAQASEVAEEAKAQDAGPSEAAPAESEEKSAPSRAPRGRPRNRRRAANGAKDPAKEKSAKDSGASDDETHSAKTDDDGDKATP